MTGGGFRPLAFYTQNPLDDVDGDVYAGMYDVVHVIRTVLVHYVNVIGIAPANGPGVNEAEGIAAIVEAVIVVVALVDVEMMPAAETGAVMRLRNATVSAAA